jgi:hypothetical protein
MVRLAVLEDLPRLTEMAKAFLDESGYADFYGTDDDSIEFTLTNLINAQSLLTDGENGMVGFLIFPMYFNVKHIVSQELFWWVSKEKRGTKLGIELLKEAEKQSKKLGAKSMFMISLDHLHGDKVGDLYKRMGYTKNEQVYMRRL